MSPKIPTISQKQAKLVFDFFQNKRQKTPHAAKTDHDRPTIIIVGAGISGITAAKELTSHGFYVVMLEARDRIGGRIHSQQLEDGPYIEFGAQFLHGIKDNPIVQIGSKYNLALKPYSRNNWSAYDKDGKEIDKKNILSIINEYKKEFKIFSQQRQEDKKDRFLAHDIKDFTQTLTQKAGMGDSKLTNLAKMLSLPEFREESLLAHEESLFEYKTAINKEESESNFLITNGYIRLLDGMLQDAKNTGNIEIHLSTVVESIHHNKQEIQVRTKNNETFIGDALICSLPLGVLQQGKVRFDPPLPSRKHLAINKLKCALHKKVILEFEEVFWDNLSHFLIPYDPEMNAWLDIVNLQFFNENKAPVLISSIHSELYQKHFTDDQLIEHFIKLIKNVYPNSFKPLKNAWVTHWDLDPFTLGSYSYHPEGSSLDDNSEIARPLGCLIFVGEHTNRSPSNVQGAYFSGLAGAKQVVEQLYFILEESK